MRVFFKDLWDLWKNSMHFMKKHWLGYIIFSVIVTIVYALIIFRDFIDWSNITNIFKRNKKDNDLFNEEDCELD